MKPLLAICSIANRVKENVALSAKVQELVAQLQAKEHELEEARRLPSQQEDCRYSMDAWLRSLLSRLCQIIA